MTAVSISLDAEQGQNYMGWAYGMLWYIYGYTENAG